MSFENDDLIEITMRARVCSAPFPDVVTHSFKITGQPYHTYVRDVEIVGAKKIREPLPNTRNSVVKITSLEDGYEAAFIHDGVVWRTPGGTNLGSELRITDNDKVEVLNVGKGND